MIGNIRIRFQALAAFIFVIFFIHSKVVFGSHLMGGEITWECVRSGSDQGKLIFQLKLYRYCAGAGLQNSTSIQNPLYGQWGGTSTITMNIVSTKDLSINCGDSLLAMDCYTTSRNTYSIEEFVYRSIPVEIYGVPASYPQGTEFGFNICCRPSSVLNLASTGAYYIRAKMYRYINPTTNKADTLGTANSNTCYDSSPKFAQRPSITLCSNNPYHYSHNAFDPDIDSLVYSWGDPMSSPTNVTLWATGYSINSQLPNTSHHPLNVPASLDPASGEIKFNVFSPSGLFSSVVRVISYRAGQPIAETYRDVAISVINCSYSNSPPIVDFKDCGNCPSYPSPAKDTVYAGDTVEFIIQSTDIGFLPGNFPQRNFLNPTGFQFGNRFGDPNVGCPFPPCATLDTTNPFYSTTQNNWSGLYGLVTTFNWVADCNHLPYVNNHYVNSSTHTFVFNVNDNFCPVPAFDSRTFTVTILAPPPIPPPRFLCTQIISEDEIRINWKIPLTSVNDTFNSFRYYVLYRSSGPQGPYSILDSIDDINITSYIDTGLDLINNDYYYFIKGLSSCHSQSQKVESDTIAGLFLKGLVSNNGSKVDLNWVPFGVNNEFPNTSIPEYLLYQIHISDTTILSRQSLTDLSLNYSSCFPDTIRYYVEVYDTTLNWGCVSRSNVLELIVGDDTPPPTQLLDSVSVQADSLAIIGLTPVSYPDLLRFSLEDCDTSLYTHLTKTSSLFIDTLSGPVNGIRTYSIVSTDTCGNNNQKIKDCHSTIFLFTDYNICDDQILLSWNAYTDFKSGKNVQYRIYLSDNNGPYIEIDRTDSLGYSYNNLVDEHEYCFYIQGWENGGIGPFSSSSNRTCTAVEIPKPPEFSYIDFVTVTEDENIKLCFRSDINEDLNKFTISRKDFENSSEEVIYSNYYSKPINLADTLFCIIDTSVDVKQEWYTYEVKVYDDCNNLISNSNISNSIQLKAKWNKNDIEHKLTWNEYKEWPSGVKEYVIYQGNEMNDLAELDRVSNYNPGLSKDKNMYTYMHRLGYLNKNEKTYCYRIEAVQEKPFFRKNEANKSLSNTVCFDNKPLLFLPNTFTPNNDDNNDFFKPIGSVEGLYNYSMLIYNRWGALVFETTDPYLGWNGKYDGIDSPSGTYAVKIRFYYSIEDKEGQEIKSIFHLMR